MQRGTVTVATNRGIRQSVSRTSSVPRESVRLLRGSFGFRQKKAGLELLQASQLTLHQPYALVAVVIAYDACEFDGPL